MECKNPILSESRSPTVSADRRLPLELLAISASSYHSLHDSGVPRDTSLETLCIYYKNKTLKIYSRFVKSKANKELIPRNRS